MKSLMSFVEQVLTEVGTWCCTSTVRDFKTVTDRVEHEGLSFLTIVLPAFGRDLEKGLDQGFVSDDHFAGFARSGGLPRFLGGFLRLVFDADSGRLLDEPSVTAIQSLRQFTLMMGKINLPCSQARERRAIDGYVQCEKDLREAEAKLDPDLWDRYLRLGTLLWGSALSSVDQQVYNGEIVPQHGPGATADRLRGNSKWRQKEWTERLEGVFPHGEFLAPSWRYFPDLADVKILEPGAERPVRVITVPKSLKTPRIIAVEPTCMQYVQQGLLAALREAVDADDIASALIGWSSQVPNQHLAQQGSLDGTLATLDLREASDRVSNQHVRGLLRHTPWLSQGVDACRSRKADVPGHGVIRLAKFASMGSALCFPFEAMVFATIIFVGIEREHSRQLTRRDITSFLGRVRVFGDDIVVPKEYVHAVTECLEAFGLRVNYDKSFWTGKFRESCGKEYFAGEDVTIARVRRLLPADRRDVEEVISTVSLRNQLYKLGYWSTAGWLDDYLSGIGIPMPVVAETSPMLGRHSFLGYDLSGTRMCPNLHRPLVKAFRVQSTIPASRLDGYAALMKVLAKRSELPFADARHLERSGRAQSVSIKLRRGPVF